MANAFACRSTVRPVWAVGWPTNRLLLGALVAELAMLVAFLFSARSPDLLGQAPPTLVGLAVASPRCPAVLLADAAQKAGSTTSRAGTGPGRGAARSEPGRIGGGRFAPLPQRGALERLDREVRVKVEEDVELLGRAGRGTSG